jgi:hypothetical protein
MKRRTRTRSRSPSAGLPLGSWRAFFVPDGEPFSWPAFQRFFPFGDLSPTEGEYERRVLDALESLPTTEERNLLMDLLDTQWCVYLEQLWVQCDRAGSDEHRPVGQAHFAAARLQINSNIRSDCGLVRKDARRAMLALPRGEMLLLRILSLAAGRMGKALVKGESGDR